MMKYLNSLVLCILIFSSCLSDEERRLQTDETFEGEEIFNLSYSLSEHLMYAFQSYTYYLDTANHSTISGCPIVAVDELNKEVSLSFGEGECDTNRPLRTGKLILNYQDTLQGGEPRIRLNYEAYWVKGIKLDGMRSEEHTS